MNGGDSSLPHAALGGNGDIPTAGPSYSEDTHMEVTEHNGDAAAFEEYDEEEGGDEGEEDEPKASSDDEDYNLTHFGISQALPVPEGPPDFEAGPPQTAEEYLRWVRYEASRCPRITRKEPPPPSPQQLKREREQQEEQHEQQGSGTGTGAAAGDGSPSGSGSGPRANGGSGGGRGGGGARRRDWASAAHTPPPVTSVCQDWARPCDKWLRAFLQDFSRLRQVLWSMQRQHAEELSATQLPPLHNTRAWEALCFEQWQPLEGGLGGGGSEDGGGDGGQQEGGGEAGGQGEEAPPPPPPPPPPPSWHQEHTQQQSWRGGAAGPGGGGGASGNGRGGGGGGGGGLETDRLCGPVVRTVLALDQVSVVCLLQRHVSSLAAQPGLSYLRCQWLFSLAAVLERPVPPDAAAALRELVRRCSAWRAQLVCASDPALPRLNVLLAVAGGYFGQDEALSAVAAATGRELP